MRRLICLLSAARRRLIPSWVLGSFMAVGLLASGGCEDRSYREIGAQINVLTSRNEEPPEQAIARLAHIGRRALPQIETALHTASARGKNNLVRALDAIGDPEATAILQHFAVYDPNPDVRAACEETLGRWASAKDRRAQPAQRALARIGEKRAKGESPE